MQFTSVTLALLAATGLMAQPLTERGATTSTFVELQRKPASDGNGTLIFLGPGDNGSSKRAAAISVEERAWCRNQVQPICDNHNTARNDICDRLVSELFADETVVIGTNSQQVCYEGDAAETNAYCCVSWKNKVPNLIKGDLAPIAQGIMQDCTEDGISGASDNIFVHGTCTRVCLSNRGTDC
ncbi:hypothetical protein F5Y05DRAFT_418656 [Hypoxylon sp. FL0543]|nr:hypothetical protein F5Y05DRAFT_418656 [Hypoxylon sp. FL0543]